MGRHVLMGARGDPCTSRASDGIMVMASGGIGRMAGSLCGLMTTDGGGSAVGVPVLAGSKRTAVELTGVAVAVTITG